MFSLYFPLFLLLTQSHSPRLRFNQGCDVPSADPSVPPVLLPSVFETMIYTPKFTTTILHYNKPRCSGIVVDKRHVVTTCQCITDDRTGDLIPWDNVGIVYPTFTERGAVRIRKYVDRTARHPNCYGNAYNSAFDIGLIRTTTGMLENAHMRYARLPTYWTENAVHPFFSDYAFLASFDVYNDEAVTFYDSVWMTKVPIVYEEKCVEYLADDFFKYGKNICAGYYNPRLERLDHECALDIGSALMGEDKVVYGLLINKCCCGQVQSVGSYVAMSVVVDWIRQERNK